MQFQSMKDLQIIPPQDLPQEDGLALILRLQHELNAKIYPIVMKNIGCGEDRESEIPNDPKQFLFSDREAMSKEYLLAIIREACEALDLLNSKAWKQTKHEVDIRELKFEFIDIQHFINSLYDIWRMDRDEVLGIFLAKCKENHVRNQNKY